MTFLAEKECVTPSLVAGWFARDLATLARVTDVLLPPAPATDATGRRPSRVTVPADCFRVLGSSLADRTYEIVNASAAKTFGSK